MSGKPIVLALCTGNTARSQMCEAFIRKYTGDRFDVYSAGLEPGVLNPFTVQVMQEVGVDMSSHYAKGVEQFLGWMHISYLITVCSRAEERCPTTFVGVSNRLFWPFDDPAAEQGSDEQKLAKFREVRDQIEAKVKAWVVELKSQDAHKAWLRS